MKYQDFLFSQLFMEYVNTHETEFQNLEYDLIFGEVLKHQKLFYKSNFNVDCLSEYDCILNYLSNTIQK